jgi:hypothetical protein
MGANIQWVVTRNNPPATETIMGGYQYANSAPHAYVSIWDGSAWDDGNGTPAGDSKDLGVLYNYLYRGFDIAYESSSGRALVVGSTGTSINYWIWNGTGWENSGNPYTYSSAGGVGDIRWVKLAAKPNSNEIAMITVDSDGDVYGNIWDGDSSQWLSAKKQALETAASYTSTECVAVEYIRTGTNAGKAMFVWGAGTGGYDLESRTWNGSSSTWDSEYSAVDLGMQIRHMSLNADPVSNKLILVATGYSTSNYVSAAIWNGTGWGSPTSFGTARGSSQYRCVDASFETAVGHEGHILAVYADPTQLRYQHYNGSSWSGEQSLSTDDADWIQVVLGNNDTVHLAISEPIYDDLKTWTYNTGTSSWDFEKTLTTSLETTGTDGMSFMITPPLVGSSITMELGEHSSGQVTDQFGGTSPVSEVLFRFSLIGDDSTQVDVLNINYTTGIGVWDADVTAAALYADDGTAPGVIDGSDTLIESGVSGSGAQLSFSTSFTPASSGTDYLVKATVSNLVEDDSTTFSIGTGDITPSSGSVGGSAPAGATHTADAPPIILGDHTSGQVPDQFEYTTPVSDILFRFSLTGDDITQVTALDVNYTTDDGVVDGDVTAGMLYADDGTTPGVIDGSDTLIESGASGSGGQLSFSTNFTPGSGGADYLVKATVANLAADESTTFSMDAADLTVSAGTTAGNTTDAIHIAGISAEITIQIGGSANDSYAADDMDDASTYIASDRVDITAHMNGLSSKYNGGFRFTGLNIPPGATINSATFSGYIYQVGSDRLYCTIYGHDVASAPDFSTNTYIKNTGQRPRTTASATWQGAFGSTGWKDKDITGIVQEIVDRGDWSSGNAIALLFISDNRVSPEPARFRSYDGVPAEAAKLTIDYSPPCSYTYKRAITIDHSKVIGDSDDTVDQTDFPVVIKESGTWLRNSAYTDGRIDNVNGYDIIFKDSTETTTLAHEIEYYNEGSEAANGELVAWVKIPSLDADDNTIIYMYYGSSCVTAETENKNAVWSNGFVGVWHLHDDYNDSTSQGNNGTNSGSDDDTGKMANGQYFNSTDDIYTGSNSTMANAAEVTISAWIKPEASQTDWGGILEYRDSAAGWETLLEIKSTRKFSFGTWTATPGWHNLESNAVVPTTGFSHIVGVYDGSDKKTYIGGAHDRTETETTISGNLRNNSRPFHIGRNPGDGVTFNGVIDEVRISNVARTDGWIETSFNNQDDPSAFYGLSGEGASPNQTPDNPTINDHYDGSTISDNTPTLGFTQSDPDAPEQLKYRIQIDTTDNSFSNLVVDYTSDFIPEGAASFTVGQAAGSGTYTVGSESQTLVNGDYFWRVMSTDDTSAAGGWTLATAGSNVAFTVDTSSGGGADVDYTQDADIVSWWYLDESSGTRYDGSGTNNNDLTDINTVTPYTTTNRKALPQPVSPEQIPRPLASPMPRRPAWISPGIFRWQPGSGWRQPRRHRISLPRTAPTATRATRSGTTTTAS